VAHHDVFVRTTLTLEPDVARMLEEEVHRVRKSFKHVVNEALRRGLSAPPSSSKAKRYKVEVHEARLIPGVDRFRLNALADELEDGVLLGRRTSRTRR
jgi:hypothetical protein